MSALPLLVVVAVVAAVHPYYEPTCANPTSPTKEYNMCPKTPALTSRFN
jgi:hypothetical protein